MKKITLFLTGVIFAGFFINANAQENWIIYSPSNSDIPDYWINSIAMDLNGGKWIGTEGGGLVKFDGTTWTNYTTANSALPHNSVKSVIVESNGDKWIGTNGGVAKFDGTNWTIYTTANSGLPHNSVNFIADESNGDKWFGTNGGVAKFDGTNWTTYNTTNSSLPNNIVGSIAIDGDENKWIGTSDGVSKFDGTDWTVYTASNSDLPDDFVRSIAIDAAGDKWFGTNGGGLAKFDDINWTIYNTNNSYIPSNSVGPIAIEANGDMWMQSGELAKFDGTSWTAYYESNSGLHDYNVRSIAIADNNDKWIGTTDGIAVLEKNCESPSGLLTEYTDTESITFSWVAGENETEWNVLWGEEGFDIATEGSLEPGLTSTSFTATGLNNALTYDFYVQAVCGVDDESEWVSAIAYGKKPFITTWKTDNDGSSGNSAIEIPTSGTGYNYDIYWEEVGAPANNGNLSNQTGNTTIIFPFAGIYRVEISGDFPRIYINGTGDNQKILTIEQWGDIEWQSFESSFRSCYNLQHNATDAPDLSGVTSLHKMFEYSNKFNGDIGNWDVSTITDMQGMFTGNSIFNKDIGNWNVSNVTNMANMFYSASSFNQDIGNWDVSSVTDMRMMFAVVMSSPFNQDLSNWDVSNVTNMSNMFCSFDNFGGTHSFNQDISGWDVSNVESMSDMFRGSLFNQDISGWNVGNVTDISGMFNRASSFNQDISSWDVSNVTWMSWVFSYASSFNQDISGWDVSNVSSMSNMFNNATSFDQDLGSWDVSKVENMNNLFLESTLSLCNYESLLKGWSQLSLQSGISFHGGNSKYTSLAAPARQLLIDNFSWEITDGGQSSNDCGGVIGISPILNNVRLNIYPNPAHNQLNIELPSSSKAQNIEVYNLMGTLVLSQNAKSNLNTIDISKLTKGTYILKVQTEGAVLTSKVVKQ